MALPELPVSVLAVEEAAAAAAAAAAAPEAGPPAAPDVDIVPLFSRFLS